MSLFSSIILQWTFGLKFWQKGVERDGNGSDHESFITTLKNQIAQEGIRGRRGCFFREASLVDPGLS